MGCYVRPLGLLYGIDAEAGFACGRAGRVGGGPIGFSQAQIIERSGDLVERRLVDYPTLKASAALALKTRLDLIEAPRSRTVQTQSGNPLVMGIINVTPDSFSDGGDHGDPGAAVKFGRALIAAGADLLDIGGESTRPGAAPVDRALELSRVLPVVESLAGGDVPVSIDTRKATVMRAAVKAGADIINDVTALSFEADALAAAAQLQVPVILMHALGGPETMQDGPEYSDVVLDIFDYLEARIAACEAAGLSRDRMLADPGIGFGKTTAHNLELLRGFATFHGLGVPLVLGASRKSFIGAVSKVDVPADRLAGSLASALAAADRGAQIIRVHDVPATVQALAIRNAIQGSRP